MEFREKRREIITQFNACDHCLGRQFHAKLRGANEVVGAAIRKAKTLKEAEKLLAVRLEPLESAECGLCGGLFSRVGDAVREIENQLKGFEYSTLLVGCRLPPQVMAAEERLFTIIGTDDVESIKREVNRTIGKMLTDKNGKKVDFDLPDLNLVYDFTSGKLELQVNPLFIYGRYQKLERGLPQTKWPCSNCFGRGCDKCGNTGKQYKETVEDLLADVILAETGGKGTSFHGHGREDKDARMLGEGRPFVLEVERPHKRDLDWGKLEAKINKKYAGKIQVAGLRPSNKQEVVLIKTITFNKSYRALVRCEEKVTMDDLKKLEALAGVELEQRTPTRVAHRRADKVRNRKVISIGCTLKGKSKASKEFECHVVAEAGTYIKELINGDFGRTKPSFASALGKNCECVELDVLDIIETKKG